MKLNQKCLVSHRFHKNEHIITIKLLTEFVIKLKATPLMDKSITHDMMGLQWIIMCENMINKRVNIMPSACLSCKNICNSKFKFKIKFNFGYN